MITLKNGQVAQDPRLDRVYELDWNSLDYPIDKKLMLYKNQEPMYRPRSYTWRVEAWLDQGPDGACVGFAYAHELAARPQVVEGLDFTFAKETLYWEAQKIDYWAGGSYPGASPFYEGTSTLAGAKICQRLGFYKGYYWAFSIEELARGLAYFGPCVFGTNWYETMFYPDRNGFIRPGGSLAGGHAILLSAIKIVYKSTWAGWWNRTWNDVDWDRSYVTIHNSWGKSWGENGTAKMTLRDLSRLLAEQGEACFPERNYGYAA